MSERIEKGGSKMEDEYLIQPVEETRMTIFESTIDLGTDISEVCIDTLQEDGFVKDFPVLGTVYKVGKIGHSVGRLLFIKKVLVFAQEMQRNDVNRSVLNKHKQLYSDNPKKYYKELEIILEYLNRQVGNEKSILNARAYYLYLDEKIEYDDLELLWEVIDQLFLSDMDTLIKLYKNNIFIKGEIYNQLACKRLCNCGMIDFFNGMSVKDPDSENYINAKISSIGKFFCEKLLRI